MNGAYVDVPSVFASGSEGSMRRDAFQKPVSVLLLVMDTRFQKEGVSRRSERASSVSNTGSLTVVRYCEILAVLCGTFPHQVYTRSWCSRQHWSGLGWTAATAPWHHCRHLFHRTQPVTMTTIALPWPHPIVARCYFFLCCFCCCFCEIGVLCTAAVPAAQGCADHPSHAVTMTHTMVTLSDDEGSKGSGVRDSSFVMHKRFGDGVAEVRSRTERRVAQPGIQKVRLSWATAYLRDE